MTVAKTFRVVVMISGRGSNLGALIRYAQSTNACRYHIVGVLSDQESAGGLELARSVGIPTAVEERNAEKRDAHEARILRHLEIWQPRLLVLAGFMRVLSRAFVQQYIGRIVNIHPSLLPRHPGLDTHRRALEAGDRQHGCTVHLVNEGVDTGLILAQQTCTVHATDTSEILAARVLELEHKLYPVTLERYLTTLEAQTQGH